MVRAYLTASEALKDRKGVTAVEYGLIAGLIAVAIIAILNTLGGSLTGVFNKINTNVSGA
jgi:pilus assembly protein Flp/PilA